MSYYFRELLVGKYAIWLSSETFDDNIEFPVCSQVGSDERSW